MQSQLFNESKKTLSELTYIPQNIQQKLLYIQSLIKNEKISLNLINLLHKQEIKYLKQLKKESLIQTYAIIIQEVKNSSTPEVFQLMKGIIDLKGQTLGIWRKKEFILDGLQKTFELKRKNKGKAPRIINLQFYACSLFINDKERSVILLQCFQKDSKYKRLILGSLNKQQIENLYKYIQIVIQMKNQQNEKKEIIESKIQSEEDKKKEIIKTDEVKMNQQVEEIQQKQEFKEIEQEKEVNNLDEFKSIYGSDQDVDEFQSVINLSQKSDSGEETEELDIEKQQLGNQDDIQEIKQIQNHELLSQQKGFLFYKHSYEQFKYKIKLTCNSKFKIDQLSQFLFDIDKMKQWNKFISSDQTKRVQVVSPNISEIIYEKRQINSVVRDCIYLRHLIYQENTIIINDNSIDLNQIFGAKQTKDNSFFKQQILIENKGENIFQINWCIAMMNNGFQNDEEDEKFTMLYYSQIQTFKEMLENDQLIFEQRNQELNDSLDKEINEPQIELKQKVEEETVNKNFTPIQKQEKCFKDLSVEDKMDFVEQGQNHHYYFNYRYTLEPSLYENFEYVDPVYKAHEVFKYWMRDKNGVLVYQNKEIASITKKALTYLIKKASTMLLSGQSILNISLPVWIFQRQSHIQQFAESFKFLPTLLHKDFQNEIEEISSIAAFAFTTIYMFLELRKPFNPILGETFQCTLGGSLLYFEQTSHHPPRSHIQVYSKYFYLTGYIEQTFKLYPNSAVGKNFGYLRIKIKKSGNIYTVLTPSAQMSGTTYGDFRFTVKTPLFVLAKELNLIAQVNVGSQQRNDKKLEDELSGGVYRIKPNSKVWKIEYKKLENIVPEAIQQVASITGFWNQQIELNKQVIWSNIMPDYVLEVEPKPLPSDSCYRLDLILLQSEDLEKSQQYKEKLEIIQRKDKKLRNN